MGIMSPDDGLRVARLTTHPFNERDERLHHVGVAEVPRLGPAAEHRTVILLCVADDTRILLSDEEVVLRNVAIPTGVLSGAPTQVHQLCNDLVFARTGQSYARRVSVR